MSSVLQSTMSLYGSLLYEFHSAMSYYHYYNNMLVHGYLKQLSPAPAPPAPVSAPVNTDAEFKVLLVLAGIFFGFWILEGIASFLPRMLQSSARPCLPCNMKSVMRTPLNWICGFLMYLFISPEESIIETVVHHHHHHYHHYHHHHHHRHHRARRPAMRSYSRHLRKRAIVKDEAVSAVASPTTVSASTSPVSSSPALSARSPSPRPVSPPQMLPRPAELSPTRSIPRALTTTLSSSPAPAPPKRFESGPFVPTLASVARRSLYMELPPRRLPFVSTPRNMAHDSSVMRLLPSPPPSSSSTSSSLTDFLKPFSRPRSLLSRGKTEMEIDRVQCPMEDEDPHPDLTPSKATGVSGCFSSPSKRSTPWRGEAPEIDSSSD